MHLIAGTRDEPLRGNEGEASTLFAERLHLVPELGRAVAPWSDAVAFLALLRLLVTWRFDVVHTHMTKAGVLGRAAAVLAGTPVIVHTEHGLSLHYSRRRAVRALYDAIERVGSRWSDLVFLVSEHDAQVVITEMRFSAERIALAKLGVALPVVDASRDAATRRRWGVSEVAPVYGTVTRLVRSKRVDDLIRATAVVRRSHPDASCVIVGGGPEEANLRRLVGQLGLD
jgi:glycosyltransferase involved in cell wall biosynthesis